MRAVPTRAPASGGSPWLAAALTVGHYDPHAEVTQETTAIPLPPAPPKLGAELATGLGSPPDGLGQTESARYRHVGPCKTRVDHAGVQFLA
jgi:hypothetical protein